VSENNAEGGVERIANLQLAQVWEYLSSESRSCRWGGRNLSSGSCRGPWF